MRLPKYKIDKYLVRAIITKPTPDLKALLPVRSLVHLPLAYPVYGGEILYRNNKPYILLADHHEHLLGRVFSGLHINTSVEVIYFQETMHPVTNMSNGKTETSRVTVPAVIEVGAEVTDNNLTSKQNIYYLGTAVSLDDKIDNVRVRKVDLISGVYRVEAY
jgi:hypothetical protein